MIAVPIIIQYSKTFMTKIIIWLDSFLQSHRLLGRTSGFMNFSKNFQNLQNNLKNDFKELWKNFLRFLHSSEDF